MRGMKFFSDEMIEEEAAYFRKQLKMLADIAPDPESLKMALWEIGEGTHQGLHEGIQRLEDWQRGFKPVPAQESSLEAAAPASPPDHS